jgi:hypothetical protein
MTKSLSYAEITGSALKNPARFREKRGGIASPALGAAPNHFAKDEKSCWQKLKSELPWLCEADRCLAEMTCVMRAKFERRETTLSDFGHYKTLLTALGATPVARGRIKHAPAEDDSPMGGGHKYS